MVTRLTLAALAACVTTLWGQTDANKATIVGSVLDPSGAAIRDAKVTAVNANTGMRREAGTNASGQYRFGSLDPGAYDLTVDAAGFAPMVAKNLTLTVGGYAEQNFNASLQMITMVVNLTEPAPSTSAAEPSQAIHYDTIRDLPINGRRFQDFATLTPTALAVPETRGQLSLAGQRGINTNVMIDGADYNEPLFGGIRGGDRSNFAFTTPQTGIQEFQAITTGYTPQYGRSTGGILNVITRSGANSFHGETFYQIRHQNLGVENPLGQQSLETQHQFGAGVGGPIRRDRLFFFAAAEQQFASAPRAVRFRTLDAVAGNVTPDIAPAYQYFRSLEQPFKQRNDATAALGRLDYQFGAGSKITGRYNHSQNKAANAASGGAVLNTETNTALSHNGTELDDTDTAVGQWTSVFSATMLNDLRAQYSREGRGRTANSLNPTIQAGIIGSYGTDPLLPGQSRDARLEFSNGLTRLWGNHSFKFGGEYSHITASQTSGSNQFGLFNIASPDVRGILQILSRGGGAAGNRLEDPSVTYLRQVGNLTADMTSWQRAFFAVDSWRVKPNLTLDFGARWSSQFNPSPVLDNDFLVTNVRDFAFPLGRVNPGVIRSQRSQWAPHAAIAWNVDGQAKTVVRAQSSLYYAQTPLSLYAAPVDNFRLPGGDLTLEIAPAGSSSVYRQFLAGGFDFNQYPLNGMPVFSVPDVWIAVAGMRNQFAGSNVITTSAGEYRDPRAFQASVGVERRVASGLVVDYQLNHVNTTRLERNIDYNVPLPFVRAGDQSLRPFFGLRSGTSRPNPNLGAVLVRESNARSTYTGQTFRAQYRRSKFQFSANYTLGFNDSNDDNERSVAGVTYQNPYDLRSEFHRSALDARHQIGGYGIYQAPWGIELAALFHYRSGLPIDATTGDDTSELLTGPIGNRPLAQPGVPFPRNAFQNRGFKSIDFRFLKDFPRREARKFQFSCEIFNLLNFSNVAFLTGQEFVNPAFIYGLGILPNGQTAPVNPGFLRLRNASGQYDPATVGQLGTPFQAQLGGRYIF
jgi:hypothetical protein